MIGAHASSIYNPAPGSTLAEEANDYDPSWMWNQPYLETCCRSALHRLVLCKEVGRPPALKDGPCLTRLTTLGFAQMCEDGRFRVTNEGLIRHELEISPQSHTAPTLSVR